MEDKLEVVRYMMENGVKIPMTLATTPKKTNTGKPRTIEELLEDAHFTESLLVFLMDGDTVQREGFLLGFFGKGPTTYSSKTVLSKDYSGDVRNAAFVKGKTMFEMMSGQYKGIQDGYRDFPTSISPGTSNVYTEAYNSGYYLGALIRMDEQIGKVQQTLGLSFQQKLHEIGISNVEGIVPKTKPSSNSASTPHERKHKMDNLNGEQTSNTGIPEAAKKINWKNVAMSSAKGLGFALVGGVGGYFLGRKAQVKVEAINPPVASSQ